MNLNRTIYTQKKSIHQRFLWPKKQFSDHDLPILTYSNKDLPWMYGEGGQVPIYHVGHPNPLHLHIPLLLFSKTREGFEPWAE